jgi:hypothetical protein
MVAESAVKMKRGDAQAVRTAVDLQRARRCREAVELIIKNKGEEGEGVWAGGIDVEELRTLVEDCENLALCDELDRCRVASLCIHSCVDA